MVKYITETTMANEKFIRKESGKNFWTNVAEASIVITKKIGIYFFLFFSFMFSRLNSSDTNRRRPTKKYVTFTPIPLG